MRLKPTLTMCTSCLLVVMTTCILLADTKTKTTKKEPVELGVPSDQAVGALHPVTGPVDLNEVKKNSPQRQLTSPSRGLSSNIFPRIAPSTVVVRTQTGYGTGFLIGSEGWLLTNDHVIESANVDVDTGARFAHIHFGHLEDGIMVLEKESFNAYIYTSSSDKDLALLKLITLPKGRELTPIKFADNNATPGTRCITIGHPSRGLFWSIRSGEIVGVGTFPHDLIDTVMPQFQLTDSGKKSYEETLLKSPKRKIVTSTCGINPGDSGGPLLNSNGELIAVNFAIPKVDTEKSISYDKFTYHVHLDEVKEFTSNMPEKPEVFRPNCWAPATLSRLLDTDSDGTLETWVFAMSEKDEPNGMNFDLDGDTPTTFVDNFKAGKANRSNFDFEVAYVKVPNIRMFYDRDNNGDVDMVLTDTDGDGLSDLTIAKQLQPKSNFSLFNTNRIQDDYSQIWHKVDSKEQKMLDSSLFLDEAIQRRFATIVTQQTLKKSIESYNPAQ